MVDGLNDFEGEAVDPGGPLAGVRVVDLTVWMAGSVASMLLADLGADVVKVEPPRGDPTRAHVAPTAGAEPAGSGQSLSFTACNRNKRSLVLDLKQAHNLEVMHQLLARADVFVTNLAGPALTRLGLDEATVAERHPDLIHARSAGLGTVGPRADDFAQDMTGMAYGGMLFTASGEPDEPFAPPGSMNDVLTGTMVAFGVLAALAQRRRTGKAHAVSGSLLQTSLWSQMLLIGSAANTQGASTEGRPRRNPRNALLNQYRAADGRWIAVAAINANAWLPFINTLCLEPLLSDERFATFESALQHSAELRVVLDEHFATKESDHWLDLLRSGGIWCGPVNQLTDVVVDEHVEAEGYLSTLSDGVRTVTMPFHLSGYTVPQVAGPALGADEERILHDWDIVMESSNVQED
ncbi:CoA transferase [Dactylosporangium sp. NPDC051485]|uniref:CaiB/BaiF CoA transferase family protein n=1 Tax=Dactylosporangium sp. NPDC051485 TaxID=3154846 RepID=UPI00344A239C